MSPFILMISNILQYLLNLFHATGLFLDTLKTSENLQFSRGYKINGKIDTKWADIENGQYINFFYDNVLFNPLREVSKYGVFSGQDFPVFSLDTGKYGPEKTPYLNTFHTVIPLPGVIIVHGIYLKKLAPFPANIDKVNNINIAKPTIETLKKV